MTIRALIEAVERGEFWGDLPRPHALHTDLCWKAFHGSIDAALALHEALLPGSFPGLSQNIHSGEWHAWCQDKVSWHYSANNAMPARALLLAILRAVKAEGQP